MVTGLLTIERYYRDKRRSFLIGLTFVFLWLGDVAAFEATFISNATADDCFRDSLNAINYKFEHKMVKKKMSLHPRRNIKNKIVYFAVMSYMHIHNWTKFVLDYFTLFINIFQYTVEERAFMTFGLCSQLFVTAYMLSAFLLSQICVDTTFLHTIESLYSMFLIENAWIIYNYLTSSCQLI